MFTHTKTHRTTVNNSVQITVCYIKGYQRSYGKSPHRLDRIVKNMGMHEKAREK